MANALELRDGKICSYKGENWRIVHVVNFERLLAARLIDNRYEFLPIEDIQPSIETGADATEADSASENFSCDTRKRRRVRQLPTDSSMTVVLYQELEAAMAEFRSLSLIAKAGRQEKQGLLNDHCRKFGYNQATAYRRLKIVQECGSAEALLRSVRADKGGTRIAPEVVQIIRNKLNTHRFVETPKTLPAILELVNGELRQKKLPEISRSTLTKFEKELPLKEKLEAQGQNKKARDAFRAKVGHLPNKDYPLAVIQVDHTPIQVCLVDETDRQPIGDAWLTLVIDCYSRMVLGFYLTFEAPSTLSTGLALAHAFLPKEEYLRQLGIKGEWPCWGFPDVVLVDNAAELNGLMMHGARRRYRFTLRDRPVGAPNFGGHVESAFRTFMFELKSIPGTKFSNPVERGEYDSEGRAIFTISEFEAYFTEFLVNDYHLQEHTGDGMDRVAPLMKWKRGVFEGDVMPPTGLPERVSDPLALRISLMPFKRRTIRHGTIEILSDTYHTGALTLISDRVDLRKSLEDRLYEIRYDPRNVSKVWCYYEDNDAYIEVPFADLRKGPISLWEVKARNRRKGSPANEFKDERYESKLRREEMKVAATKKTKRQRLESEKERLRAQKALVEQPPPMTKTAPSTTKPKLNPDRLLAMRNKVRAAVSAPSSEEGNGDDS